MPMLLGATITDGTSRLETVFMIPHPAAYWAKLWLKEDAR